MKYYVCIGDRTTGGGIVVEGCNQVVIMGKPTAVVSMKAVCCGRPQQIINGYNGHIIMGKAIAYHGSLITCGHSLVASQNLQGWDSAGGDSPPPAKIQSKPQKYHEFFKVLDSEGKPLADQKYKLTADDGSILEGYTDSEGKTGHLWTNSQSPINLEFVDDEIKSKSDEIYHITNIDKDI